MAASPFAIRNVRLFIAFRVFFNARFYYPVFTILFLDYGLTLDQFALLNAAWAASIVLLEVPSGALADILGRRNLLVSAAGLMVVEMMLLSFAPRGHGSLLFGIFLFNRVLSGAAEAAASGADEALAYDALVREGMAEAWGRVLERQMILRSAGAICAMTVGAAVYDPELVNRVAGWLGMEIALTQGLTLRFPPLLTLLGALAVLVITLRMEEVTAGGEREKAPSARKAFRLTLRAGGWILKTPMALVIIVAGLMYDHIIRMLITLGSQYYRLIQLPEATFGLIGSGVAVMGLFIPRLARKLAENRTPLFNLNLLAGLTFAGLVGLTFFVPYFGLVPMLILFCVMLMVNFFVSHYLNRITDSSQRATVLSFKGLSFNLAYGLIGILYSLLLTYLRSGSAPGADPTSVESTIFIRSVTWFPWYFLLMLFAFYLFARWQLKGFGASGIDRSI
jgi:MFS family permease